MAPQTRKEQGSEFFKRGDYGKALDCYRDALQRSVERDASDVAARILLHCNCSLACLKLDLREEACKEALTACELDVTRAKSLFRLASACLAHGLARPAADVAAAAIELCRQQGEDSTELEALRARADAQANNGHVASDAKTSSLVEGVHHVLARCRARAPSGSGEAAPENGQARFQHVRCLARIELLGMLQLPALRAATRRPVDAYQACLCARLALQAAAAETSSEAARQAATDAYKAGDYDTALKLYTTALQRDPSNQAARGSRCATLLMLKRFTDARGDAEAILAEDPSNARACSRLSKALLGCGDIPGALHWAREAVGHAPASAPLRADVTRLARVEAELEQARRSKDAGDAAVALRAAQIAASLTRETPCTSVLTALADAQLLSGEGEAALMTSRDALRSGTSSAALEVHARALMAIGNIARALTMYEQLYQGDPDNTGYGKALKQLRALVSGREAGNAAFKEGRYQQAYDEYTRSLNAGAAMRNTFIAQVATNRANVCLKLNRASDAVRDSDLAIQADDSFAKGHLRRAQAQEQLADWEEAVKSYSRAKQLDGDMAGIDALLKNASAELKKARRVDYYKLLSVSPDAGDVDVKKAYKRAALKCHPDKVPQEERAEAEKKFKLLGEANAILTDSTKRQRYDAGWSAEEIEQGHRDGEMFGGMGGGGMGGMSGADAEMLFSLFGGMRGGGGGRRRRGFH